MQLRPTAANIYANLQQAKDAQRSSRRVTHTVSLIYMQGSMQQGGVNLCDGSRCVMA